MPGDVVVYTAVDMVAGPRTRTWFEPSVAGFSEDMHAAVVEEYPLACHYFAHPDDVAPRRISDCVSNRAWRSSRAYTEFFERVGARHQLGIMTTCVDGNRGCGWAINRSTRDFTDDEVEWAMTLRPMLALLDRIYAAGTPCLRDGERQEEARQRTGLTPRQHDMIMLLAQGLSAKQIAKLRGIERCTVSKHLENAYRILGCHDRVSALNQARELGLL